MGEGGQARGPRFGFDRSVGQKQEGVFEKDNAFFRYCIFRVILTFEKTPMKISKNIRKSTKKHVEKTVSRKRIDVFGPPGPKLMKT